MDRSRLRQQVASLYREIGSVLKPLLARSPLFPASLYEHKVRCGKPQCKCARGDYRHRMWCVSFLEGRASRTRVVPQSRLRVVRKLTDDYRRFRVARRELQRRFRELLEGIDRLGRERSAAGRKEFLDLAQRVAEGGSRSRKGRG